MIILGDRYSFSKIEKERLKKEFQTIYHISYNNISTSKLIERLKEVKNTLIVLNTETTLPSKLITYLSKLELKGVEYITIEEFLEKYLHKCLIAEESQDDSILKDIKPYSKWQYFQKRFIDYIAVAVLLIPTIIAIIYSKYRVSRESPGPLFFKQLRVGRDREEFWCIKLRSMRVDAEKDGAMFATENDPRTFPWGKTLRDRKIDELIQIWNVAKGEMHLVGPRPERKIWTREFKKSIPLYCERHIVAPGITGLAQIKYQYGSGKLDAQEKLAYDLYYIKNWSLRLELEIIYKTALFLLTKKRKNLSNF